MRRMSTFSAFNDGGHNLFVQPAKLAFSLHPNSRVIAAKSFSPWASGN
jgi:hypothetical protein